MAPATRSTAEEVDLTPSIASGDLARVVLELEVGGDLKVRDQSDAKATNEQGPVKTVPMSVNGTVEYDERLLGDKAGELPRRAVRFYRSGNAVLKIADGGETRTLPDDVKLVLVDAREGRPVLASATGPLQRDELDLIDLVGNTTILQALLPGKSVADGETWQMDSALAQMLLGLDSVASCEIQNVLDEVNSGFARIRFTGSVNGAVDGAATELLLQGVYLFDRKLKRINQLNLAIKEIRSISPASPGLDVVAKLRVKVTPLAESAELNDEAIAKLPGEITDEMQLLELRDEKLGFSVTHDRQWFVTGDRREQKTLRRVDENGLVAQCTMSVLPPQSLERQTTLEQFVSDIQLALGKNFGEIASSEQWTNKHGERCLAAGVRGQVDGVPVEWRYYLLTPEDGGRRLSVVVTVAQEAIDRLGKIDREMIDQIELLSIVPGKASETARRELHTSVMQKK